MYDMILQEKPFEALFTTAAQHVSQKQVNEQQAA